MMIKILFLFLAGLYVSYTDIRYRIIPDYVTLPLIGTGIVYSLYLFYVGDYLAAILSVTGGLFVFLYIFALFFFTSSVARDRAVLGGGDIKLFVGLGFWLGLHLICFIVFVAALLAFVFTLLRGFLGRWIQWPLAPNQNSHEDPYPIPFGFYITLASVLTFAGYYGLFVVQMGGI